MSYNLDWVWKIQSTLVSSWASTEQPVEGEPGTLRIQVCTRCVIGAGFSSLYRFVSNEIIFADVVLLRYHCETVSGLKCTGKSEGAPSLNCVYSTKAKLQLIKEEEKCLGPLCFFFFLTPIFHKLLCKRLFRVILAGLLWTQWLGHHWKQLQLLEYLSISLEV